MINVKNLSRVWTPPPYPTGAHGVPTPMVLFLMSCARLFETWPIKFKLLNNKNSLYSFYKGEKCGVWSQELFLFLKAGPEASNQQGFVNSGTFIKFSMPWRSFHIIVSTTSFRLQHYSTQRTEGRLNLNFQAHPYGVAFLNPWNMPKYPIKTLNSKIDFKAMKRAKILSFLKKIF